MDSFMEQKQVLRHFLCHTLWLHSLCCSLHCHKHRLGNAQGWVEVASEVFIHMHVASQHRKEALYWTMTAYKTYLSLCSWSLCLGFHLTRPKNVMAVGPHDTAEIRAWWRTSDLTEWNDELCAGGLQREGESGMVLSRRGEEPAQSRRNRRESVACKEQQNSAWVPSKYHQAKSQETKEQSRLKTRPSQTLAFKYVHQHV